MRIVYRGDWGRVIGYGSGYLCIHDQAPKVNCHLGWDLSRWELMKFGLNCIVAAVNERGGAKRVLSSEEKQERDLKLMRWAIGPIVRLFRQ